MMRFWKLVNFEISRFIFIFSVMMGIIVGCQFTSALLNAYNYVNRVEKTMKENNLTYAQYHDKYGLLDMQQIISSLSFVGPVMFGIAVLVIYVFFIWYREWFGKATFSYRLLMLPMNRMSVYFAKLVTLLLFIFAALAIEVTVIYSLLAIIPKIIPSEVYNVLSAQQIFSNDLLYLILPISIGQFLFDYLLGIAAVMVVFTMILFERSYKLKGILFGVLFAICMVTMVLVPVIYNEVTSMLFLNELYILVSVIALIVCALSFVTSNYLLKHKISA